MVSPEEGVNDETEMQPFELVETGGRGFPEDGLEPEDKEVAAETTLAGDADRGWVELLPERECPCGYWANP